MKDDIFIRKKQTSDCPGNSHAVPARGELSYLAPLGSENISAPYFKQCFFRGAGNIYFVY